MAEPINYLIGRGETLVQPIDLLSGGGSKAHPYSFSEAYERLSAEMVVTEAAVGELPQLACPNDEAVVSITLHPSYLAKSYHPGRLLSNLGLRQVGSRERRVMPAKWTQKEPPTEPLVAPELYIAGSRRVLSKLSGVVSQLNDDTLRDEFRRIEHIAPLGGDRIKVIAGDDPSPPLEVVLHADTSAFWGDDVLVGFRKWCEKLGISSDFSHWQQVGGLSFLGLYAPRPLLGQLSQFAFLRTARRMPRLTLRDLDLRTHETQETFSVAIPRHSPLASDINVAIFDGGLPSDHPYGDVVVARDAPGVAEAVPAGLRHGMQVTSALLYGQLHRTELPPQPFSKIDHWRVLDEDGDDFELMSTLDRIMDVLEQQPYDFVSLSLGPDEAMLDDDVHVWTSKLDQFAASGQTLIISAAGNNGHYDRGAGLCRVQPASDGVNVLAVGAADRLGKGWARAPYSATGPGRSPGLVKPDIIAFGGSDAHPFFALDENGLARGVTGTSFSAPSATRLGVGLKALFGPQLSAMAVKALLVHRAETDEHPQSEVGWGCLPANLDELATCGAGEATVVYQGVLEPSRYRRFLLPVPSGGFSGRVSIRATFVAATAVDPEDAINYTRTGVGITFRPKTVGHPGFYRLKGELRERSAHKTAKFFGQSALFENEQKLRDDAQRWEAVLKASQRFLPTTLDQPVFDIEHLARANGQAAQRSDTVNYALVVTIAVPSMPDLYNRVVRTYAGRLVAMRPQIEIPVRARG